MSLESKPIRKRKMTKLERKILGKLMQRYLDTTGAVAMVAWDNVVRYTNQMKKRRLKP